MSKKPLWGPIISDEIADEDDPIVKIKMRIRALKDTKLDFSGDKTMKEVGDERNHQLYLMEKEIVDIVYKRKIKAMFR